MAPAADQLAAALDRLGGLHPDAQAAAGRIARHREYVADLRGQAEMSFADPAWTAGLQRQADELQAVKARIDRDVHTVEEWSAILAEVRRLVPIVARAAEDRGIDPRPLLTLADDVDLSLMGPARAVVARLMVVGEGVPSRTGPSTVGDGPQADHRSFRLAGHLVEDLTQTQMILLEDLWDEGQYPFRTKRDLCVLLDDRAPDTVRDHVRKLRSIIYEATGERWGIPFDKRAGYQLRRK